MIVFMHFSHFYYYYYFFNGIQCKLILSSGILFFARVGFLENLRASEQSGDFRDFFLYRGGV